MASGPSSFLPDLEPVLVGVIQDNRQKVVGWIMDQPGCWGFLAGKAVSACREKAGRPLEETERRLVWNRLWAMLEDIKRQVST